LGFGGGGVSKLTAHTHNATLAGDGGDLSETLTDMNGVALYSLITDNSAAVAVNTADIATNTAAIAAIGEVPSGLVAIWTGSVASIPAGWTLWEDIPSTLSQTSYNSVIEMFNGQPRTITAMQFNTGNDVVAKRPSKVTWYLYKIGSPTGTVYARITDSTGTIRETSTTTIDSATLPSGSGSAIAVEFNFTGNTLFAASDMITVEFSSGSAGNYVGARFSDLAPVTNALFRQYTGSWGTVSASEAAAFIVDWNLAYIRKT
jgi:hypothetical protein